MQYFQPVSPRLEEGIVSYKFKTVTFDYSHVDSRERFKPQDRQSDRLHIWIDMRLNKDEIVFDKGYLKRQVST